MNHVLLECLHSSLSHREYKFRFVNFLENDFVYKNCSCYIIPFKNLHNMLALYIVCNGHVF